MKFRMPNIDTHLDPFTVIPKEVLQQAYLDKVGEDINFLGTPTKLINVEISDDWIILELEDRSYPV